MENVIRGNFSRASKKLPHVTPGDIVPVNFAQASRNPDQTYFAFTTSSRPNLKFHKKTKRRDIKHLPLMNKMKSSLNSVQFFTRRISDRDSKMRMTDKSPIYYIGAEIIQKGQEAFVRTRSGKTLPLAKSNAHKQTPKIIVLDKKFNQIWPQQPHPYLANEPHA